MTIDEARHDESTAHVDDVGLRPFEGFGLFIGIQDSRDGVTGNHNSRGPGLIGLQGVDLCILENQISRFLLAP